MPKHIKYRNQIHDNVLQEFADFRTIGSNIIRWANPQNGASIISDWNGEDTIAVLGYSHGDYGGGTFSGAKTCDLQFLIDVGPTASGNCSASRMTWQGAPTANQYLPLGPKTSPPDGLSNFLSGSYSIADNSPKPSDLHILLSVWFEYDVVSARPFPHPDIGASIYYVGVGATGIGLGDVMELQYPGGTSQTFFTDTNQFQISTPSPIPKLTPESTDWSDTNPHVTWIIQPYSGKQQFTVKIAGPQYLQGLPNPDANKAYFFAPPIGMKYYVHAQAIWGCGGFIPGPFVLGDQLTTFESPIHHRIRKHNQVEPS